MRHAEVDIHNINDLISKLEAHRRNGDRLWFRGHSDRAWTLSPSIQRGRENPVQAEFSFFKRFKQDAARVIEATPTDEWGWMFLMQHYGVPTRLLDFSENPLVALYFAVTGHSDRDGSLYVLDPIAWNEEHGHRGICEGDIPSCGVDEETSQYLMSSVIKSVDTGVANPPLAATGARNSRRIFAQEGTFMIFHTDMNMNVEKDDCQSVWRYKIPAAQKQTFKNHLALLSITEFTIFPELDKLARKITGQL